MDKTDTKTNQRLFYEGYFCPNPQFLCATRKIRNKIGLPHFLAIIIDLK